MAGLTPPGRRRAFVGRPEVDVAVGVLRSTDGRVLLAERRPGSDGAGFWELPGGKIDAGETPAQAAARELGEELGVRVDELEPWRTHTHDFSSRRVRLHLFHVRSWTGEPTGREGQRLTWVDPRHPAVGPLLPSNEPAMTALGLPDLMAVARVDRGPGGPADLADRIPALATRGVRLLIVRAPDLAPPQRVQVGRRLVQASRGTGLRLVLSGTPLEALQAGADGVHTGGTALSAATERPPHPAVGGLGPRLPRPRSGGCAGCRRGAGLARAADSCTSWAGAAGLGRTADARRGRSTGRLRPRGRRAPRPRVRARGGRGGGGGRHRPPLDMIPVRSDAELHGERSGRTLQAPVMLRP